MLGAALGEKALKMLPLTARKIVAGGDVFRAFCFSEKWALGVVATFDPRVAQFVRMLCEKGRT
jgi:hypothetical protein